MHHDECLYEDVNVIPSDFNFIITALITRERTSSSLMGFDQRKIASDNFQKIKICFLSEREIEKDNDTQLHEIIKILIC